MKNIIIITIFSFIACSCIKQERTIKNHAFVDHYINTLPKNKTLILEFWAPSCGTCLKLKNDIFDNAKNHDFIQKNFVLARVSPANPVYKSLFKHYNLQMQPSVLFFDGNGNEIERSVGYNGNKELYLQFLNDIVKKKNLFHKIYSNYRKDTSDINLNYQLAKKYLFRYENQKAKKIFEFILRNDPLNEYGFNSECNFRIAENSFLNDGNIEKLKTYTKDYSDKQFSPQAYIYLINYYKNKDEQKNCVITSGEAVRKFPFNADLLNKHAWNICTFKIEEDYKDALEMTETAINIKPNEARYWDTQAWIYFEMGESQKATQSEKKAVELFPHPAYKDALKKFESKKS